VRSRTLEVLEVFALASFTASVALAFFERYVAAVGSPTRRYRGTLLHLYGGGS
jgi:hypothetical protein